MADNIKVEGEWCYLLVSVKNELPTEKSICFRGEHKLLFQWEGNELVELKATHWFKKVLIKDFAFQSE